MKRKFVLIRCRYMNVIMIEKKPSKVKEPDSPTVPHYPPVYIFFPSITSDVL